jgi:hypothetical protein
VAGTRIHFARENGEVERRHNMAVVNGLEVNDISKLVDNVKRNPATAQGIFYAHNFWRGGFNVVSEVDDFTVGGAKLKHAKTLKVEGDHPKEFLGTDKGPSA